jgi:hypothetical protein
MNPKSTANSPPKITASTTAARLSTPSSPSTGKVAKATERRLLPLAPRGYKRLSMPFRPVLTTLVARVPGARGAIFCDGEGESVDLLVKDPALSEFDLRVFGAQIAACWMNVDEMARTHGAGAAVEMRLFCSEGTLLCSALRDGYYLALLMARNRPSAAAAVALRSASTALRAELA